MSSTSRQQQHFERKQRARCVAVRSAGCRLQPGGRAGAQRRISRRERGAARGTPHTAPVPAPHLIDQASVPLFEASAPEHTAWPFCHRSSRGRWHVGESASPTSSSALRRPPSVSSPHRGTSSSVDGRWRQCDTLPDSKHHVVDHAHSDVAERTQIRGWSMRGNRHVPQQKQKRRSRSQRTPSHARALLARSGRVPRPPALRRAGNSFFEAPAWPARRAGAGSAAFCASHTEARSARAHAHERRERQKSEKEIFLSLVS